MPTTEKEEKSSNEDNVSVKEPEQCVASEEYSALPETFYSLPIESVVREIGSVFHKKKYDVFQRVQKSIEECNKRFSGRKELASESDYTVTELCDSLEELFQYGLKQRQQQNQLNFVVSAANLFQNMQEIVTGSSSSKSTNTLSASTDSQFWDFCQNFLTSHEKDRFEQLKQVWTNLGKGRSFIRAALNEHSLQRYILTWLSEYHILTFYYSHWSILLDDNLAKSLPDLVKSLDQVLFALSVDKTELNVVVKTSNTQQTATKVEPVIYAPTPVKVEQKVKRKSAVVERPIASTNSTDDLLKHIQNNSGHECASASFEQVSSGIEELTSFDNIPTDPIEPELEFLKEPLVYSDAPTNMDFERANGSISSANSYHDLDGDTSSQSSRYSSSQPISCNNPNHLQLEEQLKDVNERCSLLETRVARLNLENRQLIRRLKKHFEDSGIDPSSSFAANFVITIPHTKLHKSMMHGTGSFHLYEIHITMRQNLEHWTIWRRYSDFNKLHKSLLKTHPSVSSVDFPPKKRFGNMNMKFVEERRQQLQIYLMNLVETLPQVEACKSKVELQKVFPFLRER